MKLRELKEGLKIMNKQKKTEGQLIAKLQYMKSSMNGNTIQHIKHHDIDMICEHLMELKRYKKALDKACELVADYSGSCPLDGYNIDLDCEDRCENNMKDCWKVWCLQDE